MSLAPQLENVRERILVAARNHGATDVRVFGSFARGEERPDSDIDLLVRFEAGRSLLDRIALMQEIEDLTGRKVDVVNERALHWFVRDSVIAEAVAL